MFKWLRHKQQLREIERKKELIRAQCNHSWEYVGIEYDDFNAGSSVETTRYNVYECRHCDAVNRRY